MCLKHGKALNHVLTLFCNTFFIQMLMRLLEKLPPPAILRMFLLLWKFLSGVSSCSSFGWVTPTPLDQIIVNGHNYSRFNLPPDNVDLLWGPGTTSISWLVNSFSAHHRCFVYVNVIQINGMEIYWVVLELTPPTKNGREESFPDTPQEHLIRVGHFSHIGSHQESWWSRNQNHLPVGVRQGA